MGPLHMFTCLEWALIFLFHGKPDQIGPPPDFREHIFGLRGPNLSSLVGNLDGIIILNNIPLDNKYTYYHIPSHSVTVKSTEMFFWNYVLLVPKKHFLLVSFSVTWYTM